MTLTLVWNHVVRAGAPLLVAVVLTCGASSAQTLVGNLGAGLDERLRSTVTIGLTLRNVSIVGGFALTTRILADVGPGGGLEGAGLFDLPFNLATLPLTAYGGLGLILRLKSPVELRPSFTAGLVAPLDGQLSVYLEGVVQLFGPFRVRAGLRYAF